MSNKDQIRNEYFDWLYDYICKDRANENISYKKLLMFLHSTEFIFTIDRDDNRFEDGVYFRQRFAKFKEDQGYDYYNILYNLDGPCSVLEMMVALATRCEEDIMDDPRYGNRTKQWFWLMIKNMGLSMMTDIAYNKDYVETTIYNFLNRNYKPDGRGGLFYIPGCEEDLRNVEIWAQLCWYINRFS